MGGHTLKSTPCRVFVWQRIQKLPAGNLNGKFGILPHQVIAQGNLPLAGADGALSSLPLGAWQAPALATCMILQICFYGTFVTLLAGSTCVLKPFKIGLLVFCDTKVDCKPSNETTSNEKKITLRFNTRICVLVK